MKKIIALCFLLILCHAEFISASQLSPRDSLKLIKIKEKSIESQGLLLDSTGASLTDSLTHYLSKGRTAPLHKTDKKKAIALSFLLPGLGDQYIGNKSTAIRFYIVEGSIWASFFGMRWFASIIKDDYMLYATSTASAYKNADKNNEDYYSAIEWYDNINVYNEHIREDARARYSGIDSQQMYIEENALPDSLYWDWQTKTEWNKYISLREKNRELLNKAGYCVGAAILNRIASAFLVSHQEERYNFLFEPNGVKIYFSFK